MKPEKNYHRLTDKDRDAILKLIVCGLHTDEIADIIHCSKSTVGYSKQAYTACLNQDWSTLQKLSTTHRAVVDWAMKVTGTDKVFLETFPKEDTPTEPAPEQGENTSENSIPPVITREDFYAMYATMQDIRSLLTDIRDMLK